MPAVVVEELADVSPVGGVDAAAVASGGFASARKEWSEQETGAIAADFFASRFVPLDHEDERRMLWLGTGCATGDPFHWSPVTVELLLDDRFPRKVVAEPSYLTKLPDLVRAFIRYCHDRQGIRAALTAETIAAVDHYEPSYQRVIRSARPQGPAALLAGMFEARAHDEDDLDTGEIMLAGLDREVGGRMQLQNLDDSPLPDEPFEWAGIPDDIRSWSARCWTLATGAPRSSSTSSTVRRAAST